MGVSEISIIVPIYHGKKYIENMIRQIAACALESKGDYTLELLFVNDDPGECIGSLSMYTQACLPDLFSAGMEIRTIETEQNRGIHGARVRGLEHCTGDYVLFLDQDDCIKPEYFSSQLTHLGEADAVVCKLLHEGKQFYDTRMPFEQVITRDFMISVKNPIISPGQVLIRRDKIPEIWKAAELKNNGADDWFLWICMSAERRHFALNQDVLFIHVVEGCNESFHAGHMIDSERELYQAVSDHGILQGNELGALYQAVQKAADDHMKVLYKFQKMFFVYNAWMSLYEQGIYIEDYLWKQNIRSIAIYGFSYIGHRMHYVLKKSSICVECFIDMNADFLEGEIAIYRPDMQLPAVDMIIICLVDGIESITGSLSAVSQARICSITELLEEMKVWKREDLVQERL